MAEPATARPVGDDARSIGDLVSIAIRDLTQLVRYEVDLATMELKKDLKRLGLAAALIAISAFTSFLILVMLCFALAYGFMALGVWPWAAFLLVVAACVLLIGGAALIVLLVWKRRTGLRKTRQSVQEGLAMLRRDGADAQLPPAETG